MWDEINKRRLQCKFLFDDEIGAWLSKELEVFERLRKAVAESGFEEFALADNHNIKISDVDGPVAELKKLGPAANNAFGEDAVNARLLKYLRISD